MSALVDNVQDMAEAALDALVRAIANVKRDDPMAAVTVIVPSNLAGRTVAWRLASGLGDGRRAIAGIRITTLARLAESVATVRLHPRRPLLPSILAAAWRAELAAVKARFQPWVFAEVWDHPSMVSALVRAYRDLREVRESDLPTEALGTVPAETVRLAGQVRHRLAADWYDQQDLFVAASELVRTEPGAISEFGVLLRYLTGEEPPTSQAFLAALEASFAVTTIDEPAVVGAASTADRVLHASDADDEVRMVIREVVASLTGDQSARRLAILYSRPDPYVRLIQSHLRAAGIEFNGRGGIAVAEMASSRAFLGLLALRDRRYPRPRLFEVLSTWPLRQFGSGEPVHTVSWERVSREANITGGEATESVEVGWARRLNDLTEHLQVRSNKSSEKWRRDRIEHTITDARDLGVFVKALDGRLGLLDQASSWESVAQNSVALLGELLGGVEDIRAWEHDEKRAFVTLRTTLTGLASLDAYGPPSGLSNILEVIAAQLESAVPRTGKFGQGVFVGPIAQARGLDLDKVWVVGMSEDMYPGSQQEDALLPDDLRSLTPGLVGVRERIDRLRIDFEAALRSAHLVTVSFPRGNLRKSAERLPSRLLLPTLRHLSANPHLAATEWQSVPTCDSVLDGPSFAGSINTTESPATDQEWSLRYVAALGGQFDDPVFRAGRELRSARLGKEFSRYDGNLSGTDDLPDLATSGRPTSPTSLESFAGCPFAYFVKRLLRVEPVVEPTATGPISPLDLGNIFHYTMDRFLTGEKHASTLPGAGQPWRLEHYERLIATATTVIAEHEAAGRLGHSTLWGFNQPGVLRDLRSMLDDDSAWRAANGSEPVDSELAFGFGEHPPVEIAVPGGTVLFVGSADKVDRREGTVYVTDIKSGRRSGFVKIEGGANPTLNGTKLQLPIYAKAARQAYGADAAEARYWFVRGQDAGKQIQLPLTEELEETFAHVVGTLANGIARGHFFKKPSKDPGFLWVDCEFCTPGGAGHHTARSGYERKRADPGLLDLLTVIDPEGAAAVLATIDEAEDLA